MKFIDVRWELGYAPAPFLGGLCRFHGLGMVVFWVIGDRQIATRVDVL